MSIQGISAEAGQVIVSHLDEAASAGKKLIQEMIAAGRAPVGETLEKTATKAATEAAEATKTAVTGNADELEKGLLAKAAKYALDLWNDFKNWLRAFIKGETQQTEKQVEQSLKAAAPDAAKPAAVATQPKGILDRMEEKAKGLLEDIGVLKKGGTDDAASTLSKGAKPVGTLQQQADAAAEKATQARKEAKEALQKARAARNDAKAAAEAAAKEAERLAQEAERAAQEAAAKAAADKTASTGKLPEIKLGGEERGISALSGGNQSEVLIEGSQDAGRIEAANLSNAKKGVANAQATNGGTATAIAVNTDPIFSIKGNQFTVAESGLAIPGGPLTEAMRKATPGQVASEIATAV